MRYKPTKLTLEELAEIFEKKATQEKARLLICYDAKTFFETGGVIKEQYKNKLTFVALDTREQQLYKKFKELVNIKSINEISEYIEKGFLNELPDKVDKRMAKRVQKHIRKISSNYKFLKKPLIYIFSNINTKLYEPRNFFYSYWFHTHNTGKKASNIDIRNSGREPELIFSYKLKKSGNLHYCTIHHVKNKEQKKLLTFH